MAAVARHMSTFDDEPSAALIIQLLLEDIASLTSCSKGKSKDGDLTDEQIAFNLFNDELGCRQQVVYDHEMSRSIASAMHSDRHVLAEELAVDQAARADRQMACELEGRAVHNMQHQADNHLDNEHIAKLAALYISESDGTQLYDEETGERSNEAESSQAACASRSVQTLHRSCEVCDDTHKFFDIARLPCRHEYCRHCIDELFKASMNDESLFPPRCCRTRIPLESVRLFLSSQTASEFERKLPELETEHRTYCHEPTCSAWIPPESIAGEVATCQRCLARTCTVCKAAAHNGDCPNDEPLQQLLNTSLTNGWQRCYQCRRIVELNYGCNHMT